MTGTPPPAEETGPAPGRTPLASWSRDLRLGMRFAVTGGTEGWVRTALTAIGVGLGVAMLLLAAAVPAVLHAREQRDNARDPLTFSTVDLPRSDRTLLIVQANTTYGSERLTGALLRAEGPRAPVPPGLTAVPRPGTMAVSPALARLLSRDHRLLHDRLPYRVTATIGNQGLSGPRELLYYAGDGTLSPKYGNTLRIDHFGRHVAPEPLDPVLTLLVVIGCVVLLMPVAVFIGTAVRFGGERRDRRLAALRLVGADSRMARRIAAGEALCGALLGLVAGTGFFLFARQFVGSLKLWELSVFPSDVTPAAGITALIMVAVPTAAIVVTLISLRGVVIEPLGVVRNAVPRRRRLLWRLAVPAAGLLLFYPLLSSHGVTSTPDRYEAAAGAVLLLTGLTAVLPWLVESVVRRLGNGPVPWQLACRRLQLTSGSAARLVSGITVTVAGAIAAQTLFAGVQGDYVTDTGQDTRQAQMTADIPLRDPSRAAEVFRAFREIPGVTAVGATTGSATTVGAVARAKASGKRDALFALPYVPVTVADCATLGRLAVIHGCRPGSVFLVGDPDGNGDLPAAAGRQVDLNTPYADGSVDGAPRLWRVPADARTATGLNDPARGPHTGILATPQALDVRELTLPRAENTLRFDPDSPGAADRARDTAVRFAPWDPTMTLTGTRTSDRFSGIRRGLLAGATATLLMIGVSLLVSLLEQLRERRRLLAVLVAFGTRRSTLATSVLWQSVVPVALGLGLAVVGGLGLGSVLLRITGTPIAFDWSGIGTVTAVGGGLVLGVTALTLPPLWRMMRPDGLRSE